VIVARTAGLIEVGDVIVSDTGLEYRVQDCQTLTVHVLGTARVVVAMLWMPMHNRRLRRAEARFEDAWLRTRPREGEVGIHSPLELRERAMRERAAALDLLRELLDFASGEPGEDEDGWLAARDDLFARVSDALGEDEEDELAAS
jgi:hypothetical protein